MSGSGWLRIEETDGGLRMVRMNDRWSLCDTYVSRGRAGLGSKGDCVPKGTYLAGDPFLPFPRSNEVHCQAASEKTAGCGDYRRVGELTAV